MIGDRRPTAALNDASGDVMREGLEVLDAYAGHYVNQYPFDELPAQVAETREEFRLVIDATDVARRPAKPTPTPIADAALAEESHRGQGRRRGPLRRHDGSSGARPWMGLALGGGATLGGGVVMLALFAGGLVRVRAVEEQYDDPENACPRANPVGACAEFYRQGKSMDALATVGVFAAPVLLAVGTAMLAVGLKRRASQRAFAPTYSRGMAGFVWEYKF